MSQEYQVSCSEGIVTVSGHGVVLTIDVQNAPAKALEQFHRTFAGPLEVSQEVEASYLRYRRERYFSYAKAA